MTALGDYLDREGFTVKDGDGVPYGRSSTWDRVEWLFVHHTAGSESTASEDDQAAYIRTGPDEAPMAQLMLGVSGTVWVCAKPRSGQTEPGRASHAGTGSYPGIPTDRANECALGVEVHCSGDHPLATHGTQYATLLRLLAALCRRYGLDADRVIGHKEWAPDRKIDPRDNMADLRRDVADELEDDGMEPEDVWRVRVDPNSDTTDDPIQTSTALRRTYDNGVYTLRKLDALIAALQEAGTIGPLVVQGRTEDPPAPGDLVIEPAWLVVLVVAPFPVVVIVLALLGYDLHMIRGPSRRPRWRRRRPRDDP